MAKGLTINRNNFTEKLGLKPRRSKAAFNSLVYQSAAIVIVVER